VIRRAVTRLSRAAAVAATLLGPAPAVVANGVDPLVYFTVQPCRAVDTRSASPLQDGVPRTFALHGICGVPATAVAVMVNATSVAPTGQGHFVLYPADAGAPPAAATMVFSGNDFAVAHGTIVPISASGGELTASASVAGSGTAHLVLDVNGYFEKVPPPPP
jgi:hypothetical protein